MVVKSFKTYGISNALDGTEDDELYTEDGQEIEDDEENEFESESDADDEYGMVWYLVWYGMCLIYCILLLETSLQADFGTCVTFPLVLTSEKKKSTKTLGYKPKPPFRKKFQKMGKIFCKNRSAYRRINTAAGCKTYLGWNVENFFLKVSSFYLLC